MAMPRLLALHPVLMARDVAVSVAFYERLGFHASFADDPAAPRYAGARRDGVEFHLQWADASQWAHAGDRPVLRLLCEGVDALFAELLAAGITPCVTSPWGQPGDTPWGTREFHLRDPGDNILQFYAPRG